MNEVRSTCFSKTSLARCLVWAVLAAVPSGSLADGAVEWTIDDLILAEKATQWRLAAEGSFAVWIKETVESVEDEEKRVANLWWVDLESAELRQLTRGTGRVSDPEISPDGRLVAFLSDRELPAIDVDEGSDDEEDEEEVGDIQLWILPLTGGEAFPITRFARDVQRFGWSDSGHLVLAVEESPGWWETEREQEEDTARVVDDAEHQPPVRLFRVAVPGGEVERLTHNDDWIDQLAVSPDGRWVVFRAQQSLSYEFDQKVPPATLLLDLESGNAARLFEDGRLVPSDFEWALDSRGFYLQNPFSRHPVYREATITELWFYQLAAERVEQVELDWPRGVGGSVAAVPQGVVALLADGVRNRPALLVRTAEGWQREDLEGAHVRNMERLGVSSDGRRLVYQHSKATLPPQWYRADLTGARVADERRLTDLNPGFGGKPTGKVEVMRWPGALGDEVEGLLHYPLDWQVGQMYPLVLDIHGGPAGVDQDRWDQSWASPTILWRQRGAFVLQVNYHGSAGYGQDWVESIGEGKYYELEVPDLESGVDELIERGLVDPERLAASGWSNGGILSAALITHSHRYRAAIIGAADVEWFSDWANVDFGAAFDNYYFGGPPWEIPEVYLEKSPFFRLHEVTTPVLAHTGTEDRNVPPHQSWSLFRVMQQVGKAPVRLVLYPGEPHSLGKVAHQRRKLSEDVAWFDRHLFGVTEEVNPALKPDSLLAGLLARAGAARRGPSLGVEQGELLLPETVPWQGLEVGRFEVTRAQFAAFDPTVVVDAGQENLPMTWIGFERAQEYASWLADRLGRPARLPTVQEARELAATAEADGNTLDLWAGYRPNPDDTERLLESVSGMGDSPLLLPVGSRPPAEGAPIFDLGGNAAEWVVDETGGGVAFGPSADRSTEEANRALPTPAYTGFRVVVSP